MKKFITMLMAALVLAAAPMASMAQVSKYNAKETKKEAKRLTKEGWNGEGKSVEQVLMLVAEKEANGRVVMVGTKYDQVSRNAAKKEARRAAAQEYAELSKQMMVGRIGEQNIITESKESDKAGDVFESKLAIELEKAFEYDTKYLIQTDKTGKCSAMGFFTISEKDLKELEDRVFEAAIGEVQDGNKLLDEISKGLQ